MVGDHYQDKWRQPYQQTWTTWPTNAPSRQEFDALKKEVEDMKELLKRAKLYDEQNNEPNCEIKEKMEFLRNVAKLVGIDLDDVIGSK
jgi:hypothetical protein